MSKYSLDNLGDLKREADLMGLRIDHHQMADVLNRLTQRIAYTERLRGMILHFIGENYKLSISTMIGPFLKSVGEAMTKEALENKDVPESCTTGSCYKPPDPLRDLEGGCDCA
jgi:hypothetical protein